MNKASQQRVHKQVTSARSPLSMRPTATALAIAACFSGNLALANPTAPTVVNGVAGFAQAGNILNITNSPNAIINWGSFSIGVNELTRFLQQSASSAVLNRVIGQDPSAILGALQSNGRVFLLNPNGIVFGAGSQVDVAGLVASTLNLSDQDFLNNRLNFTDGAGAGSVVNQGNITGGSVYLVGNAVTNDGIITSPQGEVILAAGNSVELVSPGTPNLRVEIVAPDNAARNLGTITADAGRIGIYAGLINSSGTLNASSAVAEGGRIVLKATKDTTLTASSILNASGVGGGRIDVLADDTVHVDGRLDASAPVSGNGGFIETSGKNRVKIADSAFISTKAPYGVTGTWLIDPNNFVIDDTGLGDITGSELSTLLNGSTDIIISTVNAASDVNGSGAYGGAQVGDILVNQEVSWSSANSLTLTAERNVVVNQPITNAGTGGINLYAGWDGVSLPATPVINNSNAAILLSAPISTAGTIQLVAGGDISQLLDTATITANQLLAVSNNGNVTLDTAPNMVNTLAGSAGMNSSFSGGQFRFKNNKSLIIGTVGGVSGITAEGAEGGTALVDINVLTGNLTVDDPIVAQGYNVQCCFGAGDAEVNLRAAGGITINSGVSANGGNADGGSGSGGRATVSLTSTGGQILVDTSSIIATGGNAGNSGSSSGIYFGGQAQISLTSNAPGASSILVTGNSTVQATGGDGGEGGPASVYLDATAGGIRVDTGSALNAYGGNGAIASNLNWVSGGSASVGLSSGGPVTINGNITATGGIGGSDCCSATAFADGGSATVSISGTSVALNGTIAAYGGAAGIVEACNDACGSASARGGSATVFVDASNGGITGAGNVIAIAGAGGFGNGTFANASGGSAFVQLSATTGIAVNSVTATGGNGGSASGNFSFNSALAGGGSGTVQLTAGAGITVGGSVTATGGSGGIAGASSFGADASGGDANVYINSATGITVKNITATGGDAGSAMGASSGGGSAYAVGGQVGIFLTTLGGVNLNGTVNATGGMGGSASASNGDGTAVVSMTGNNITVGGNVTTAGFASGSGSQSGIYLTAANKIIGGSGVLSAGLDQEILLQAVNGIGTQAAPVRLLDGSDTTGPNLNFQNTGVTGDIAVSFTTNDVVINNDVFGTFNNNPTGTYFITAENGNFVLNAPFQPGPSGGPGADLAGQSLNVVASGDVLINPGAVIVTTTGTTTLIGGNVMQTGGNITGLLNATAAGTINLSQGSDLTLGLLQAGTSVSVNSGGALLDGNIGLNIVAPTASLSSSTGVGSLANPLETKVSTLSVSAYGGEIGVINTGNLTLNSLNFGGTFAAIGATGSMDLGGPIFSATNLALLADNGLTVGQNINTSGGLSLNSGAGNLVIDGANVFAGTTIGLTGVNVSLNNAFVSASGSLVVAATGNLDVMNVSSLSGGSSGIGNATISTGGNVTVDNSTIIGNPDVVMSVDGVINTDNGGTIHAGAPTTILLTFPMLASGGYFVNGIEGVVYDIDTLTGFLANNSAAILGTNLLVTYGVGSGSLLPPTDALLAAMGDSITPPEPEKDKNIFEDIEDGEKKAPICR